MQAIDLSEVKLSGDSHSWHQPDMHKLHNIFHPFAFLVMDAQYGSLVMASPKYIVQWIICQF